MEKQDGPQGLFGEVSWVYTRAQAIAEGVLIDVTAEANDAGFKVPVSLTVTVWADVVAWSAEDSARQIQQDEPALLNDLLWSAATLARHYTGDRMSFQHHRVPRGGNGVCRTPIALVMAIGPGDGAEPVVTLMLPSDD